MAPSINRPSNEQQYPHENGSCEDDPAELLQYADGRQTNGLGVRVNLVAGVSGIRRGDDENQQGRNGGEQPETSALRYSSRPVD